MFDASSAAFDLFLYALGGAYFVAGAYPQTSGDDGDFSPTSTNLPCAAGDADDEAIHGTSGVVGFERPAKTVAVSNSIASDDVGSNGRFSRQSTITNTNLSSDSAADADGLMVEL